MRNKQNKRDVNSFVYRMLTFTPYIVVFNIETKFFNRFIQRQRLPNPYKEKERVVAGQPNIYKPTG